jgi:hypothetical protein
MAEAPEGFRSSLPGGYFSNLAELEIRALDAASALLASVTNFP